MALNLVQDRSGTSVWERGKKWDRERWLTAVAAGGVLLASIRGRKSLTGWLLLGGSGALAYWAACGTDIRRLRRAQLQQMKSFWPFSRHEDPVGEASEESFPASDPPALTPEHAQAH